MFIRKLLPQLLLPVFLVSAVHFAGAQAPSPPVTQQQVDYQNQQLELQRQQIEDLRRRLDSLNVQALPPVTKEAGYVLETDKSKPNDATKGGYEVGSESNISVRWNLANGLTFETPNKDFVSHIGVRTQEDFVFFQQSAGLRAPVAAGGIGELQDGTFFRRVRPSWDGTAYEVMEWNVELALEQTNDNIPNLDEVWVGVTQLPILGTVRVGHCKVPQGFEGDMVSSSKAMTFLERAAYTDAFYQNFGSGLWLGNSVLDQRMTWSTMMYRQDNPNDGQIASGGGEGAQFGDGKFAYSGRVTLLPLYTDEGRQLLHLGMSGTWRAGENPDPGITGPSVVEFRARPEMRDAIGAFGSGTLPGNANRLVDTGSMVADSATVWGTELFYVRGPFSIQSEYAWAWANDVVVGGVNQGNLAFNGGYLQLSYFLTGESRTYDRRFGRLGSTYIKSPYNPFFLTRSNDGGTCFGSGAWEIAARYSHLNLNDGVIQGGITDGVEVGINWYLNTNLKCQFEYLHENRYSRGPSGGVVQQNGDLDAFGTRVQFFF